MDLILALKAILMGIVEGFTEFLPISSTGHLILAGSLLNFTGENIKVFEIVIQAGAIFAVCWEYRIKIASVVAGLFSDANAQRLVRNIVIAFLPAAVLGVLFSAKIKAVLFAPVPVALAFIVGGLIILWVERKHQRSDVATTAAAASIHSMDDLTSVDALKIGLAQVFALIPGTSRSGPPVVVATLFRLP